MFQVFRRHQKRWLTALTILAMIGFAFPIGSTYFGGRGRRSESGPEVVETIFKHRVTTDDLARARLERHVANTFFQVMVTAVHPELNGRIGDPFGSTRDDESIKDSIRLSYKADQLGVRVSDDMVRTWINRATDGKLTNAQFDRVVATTGRVAPQLTGEGGMSAEILFDILKKQLRIESTRELITGLYGDFSSPVTPYECWQFYRKLNDKLGLEVIPVSVADFAAQIDDPGDTALRKIYDTYITTLPDPASPEPGFKEPRRVNLQYASVSLKDFTLAMRPELEVTDDEIKQYYDSHKDLYRIRPAAPTLAPTLPTKPATEPQETPEDKKEQSDANKEPDAKPQGTDEQKTEPKTPSPDSSSENKSDNPSPDIDADPATRGGPHDTVASQIGTATDQETPIQQEAVDEKPAKEQDKNDQKADQDKSEQDEPKQDEKKESDEKNDDEKKADDKKEDTAQYKPVEEVTDEIRELLIKDKARAEIIKRLGQLDVKVSGFQKIFLPAKDKFDEEKRDNPSLEFVAPEAPDFSKLADELGLKLAETGLTALDDESFKVSTFGQATPMESTRGFRSVADVMASAEYFEPHQFQNFVSEEFFTAWKIDDKEEREPSFEEIRDRVLLSYQMMKARERAADRANKLAESLRDVQGDMEKFREKEGGIESITIAPMTLWSSAPMFSMQMMSRRPGRMPTDLPGLRLAGEELRNKTFELKEREVTVAPNQPKEIYYVVLLAKRESASREDFARSRQFVEMQLQTELAQKMYNQWREELRREASGKVALAPAGN